MPASQYMPEISVELALTSGYTTPESSRVWTDISQYVEGDQGIQIVRGRQNERGSTATPNSLHLTLDNTTGRFTMDAPAGAYYPNIKKGRPIRVRARYPLNTPGNLFTANQSSHETDTTPWLLFGGATQAQSAVRAFDGTKSMLVTWPTGGLPLIYTTVSGLVIGRQYTLSAYVWVPVGSNAVRVGILEIANGATSTTTGAWERISYTFTATAGTLSPLIVVNGASTAGMQVWVDAWQLDEGAAVVAYTTSAPPILDRFVGYVDDWPTEWPDGTTSLSYAPISARSRLARIGIGAEFRGFLTEEIAYDRPVLHFPLSEPLGATQLGNISPGRTDVLVPVAINAGNGLVLANSTGPGTDELASPTWLPSGTNGIYLRSLLDTSPAAAGDHSIALEAWFSTTGAGANQTILDLNVDQWWQTTAPSYYSQIRVYIDTSNVLRVDYLDAVAVLSTRSSAVTPNDGNVHHVVAIVEIADAGTVRVRIIVDGVDAGFSGTSAWPYVTGGVAYFPTYRYLHVGGIITNPSTTGAPGMFGNGTIAQVAIHRTATTFGAAMVARFAEHTAAGATGCTSDTSGGRIARYARFAGIPTAEVDIDTGATTGIAHINTTNQQPVALMQKVELTEDGLLFDGRNGRLTFHARTRRFTATSAFTLDRNAGEIEEGLRPIGDDQGMANDVTASRAGGIQAHALLQSSIDDYGYYRESYDLVTTSDAEVRDRADWQVQRRGVPRSRYQQVVVDVINSSAAKAALLLAADISTRFTLANLPSQAPAATADLFVEGYTEDIGPERYGITFNTSPVAYSSVWVLDSATASQLDSTTVLGY